MLGRVLLADRERGGEDGEKLGGAKVFEAVESRRSGRCPLHFHFGADACGRVERACRGHSSTHGERRVAHRGGMRSRFWKHFDATRAETRTRVKGREARGGAAEQKKVAHHLPPATLRMEVGEVGWRPSGQVRRGPSMRESLGIG